MYRTPNGKFERWQYECKNVLPKLRSNHQSLNTSVYSKLLLEENRIKGRSDHQNKF